VAGVSEITEVGDILRLAPGDHGTWIGRGPQYPWGGLYGGQIVAQALEAAAAGVPDDAVVHSLRAYFIRRGDHEHAVLYEVDPLRDGRSFTTRRVVAHQATGAILNLEASFQRPESSEDIETVAAPVPVPAPGELEHGSWSPVFERAMLPPGSDVGWEGRDGAGRAVGWFRCVGSPGDRQVDHAAALAYMSDDLPTDAVVRSHPIGQQWPTDAEQSVFTASLDHTMWFHRPFRADEWHLHDVTCHTFVSGRGLAIGHVFTEAGVHVATFAQEVLLRHGRH
jgi:acyl-CoA thioesterase-2